MAIHSVAFTGSECEQATCDHCGATLPAQPTMGEATRAMDRAGWWHGAINCTASLDMCGPCTMTALPRLASGAR